MSNTSIKFSEYEIQTLFSLISDVIAQIKQHGDTSSLEYKDLTSIINKLFPAMSNIPSSEIGMFSMEVKENELPIKTNWFLAPFKKDIN